MKKILFYLYFFLNMILIVNAQLDSLYEIIADHIETDNGFYETLQHLLENPININFANKEDLEFLPFLSVKQIDSLLVNKPFKKRSEIRKILGHRTYRLFQHFFILRYEKVSTAINCTHRVKYPVEKNKGIKDRIYIGSPVEYYNKIKIAKGNNLSAALLSQKDIGEKIFSRSYYRVYSMGG